MRWNKEVRLPQSRKRAHNSRTRRLCLEPLERRELLSLTISEFQADNSLTLEDFDGDSSDWIEVYNGWADTIHLNGWYLTDDPENLTKWEFPDITLGANRYLTVFASGKDTYELGELHTNFRLEAETGYLALVAPDGQTTVGEFVDYPAQFEDVSYGLATGGAPAYFAAPTPGTANGVGIPEDPTHEPSMSIQGGTFSGAVTVELSSDLPDGVIRYTTNGSRPSASNGIVYSGAVTLDRTTVLKACVARPGEEAGPVHTETYVRIGSDLVDFDSNLPLVVIDTYGNGINQDYYTKAASVFIDVADGGRASVLGETDYAGNSGLKIRGSSSAGYAKKQYAFETWNEVNNDDQAVSLFGMPEEADWVLFGAYSDKTLMRNDLAYKWSNDIGQYAPHTEFCEVFIDTDGDGIITWSDYQGVYSLIEKIKRDPERVDVEELSHVDSAEPDVTGGYIFKRDRRDPGDVGFSTAIENHPLSYVEPKEDEITAAQSNYLISYLNEFETVLHSENFADPETGYAAYIDVDSFIDNHILNEWMKNIDGFWLSQFFYKDRNDVVVAGPLWDFDRAIGNANYRDGWTGEGWYWEDLLAQEPTAYKWYPRLFEDPAFQQKWIDRWFELRQTVFSTESLLADVDAMAVELAEAQVRNFEKWQILGVRISPNWYVGQTYQDEIDWMKQWISERVEWIDAQYLPLVTLSEPDGYIDENFSLTMSAEQGGIPYNVYYTLDGSDPFTPVEATNATFIQKGDIWKYNNDRTDLGTAWKEPGYNDSPWDSGPAILGDGESYLSTTIDIGEYGDRTPTIYFRKEFDIQNANDVAGLTVSVLRDDAMIVYLNGQEIARDHLPDGAIYYADYSSGTASGGDETTYYEFSVDPSLLVEGTNTLAVEVHQCNETSSDLAFDLELSGVYAGMGGAVRFDGTPLVFEETTFVTARAFDGANWSAPKTGLYLAGSAPNVAITEVMYNPADPARLEEEPFGNDDFEFIELTNLDTQRVYLTGLQLTEGITFDFATSAVPWLDPGESVVVVENLDAFEARYGTALPVAGVYDGKLSNGGEQIVLSYGLSETVQDFTYDDGGAWPGRPDGTGSSLEILDPLGDYNDPANWRASGEYGGTPGSPGQGNLDDIVINEVLTHTDPPSTDTIELFNTTGELIDIGGWYLSDAGGTLNKFRIPDGTTIPSGGYVTFDESDFNASGGIDPNDFALSSSEGDDVWLMEADASGNLLRFVDHVEFGAALNGESFGRYPNATGRLYPMSETTLGDENAAPRVGPVIISEIQYASGAAGETDAFEFVEIYNPTDGTIDLSDWEIDGIGYVFPEGSQIGAEEAIVVVPFDPADTQAMQAFLDYYEVTEVTAMGPYSGRLDNSGERIRLFSTDEPPAENPTLIPLITEDEVAYETVAPWPDLTVDARSLNRAAEDAWGDTDESWAAGDATPGSVTFVSEIPGDLNDDGLVASGDLDIVRANWGATVTPGDESSGDATEDGLVNSADLDVVRGYWGQAAAAEVKQAPAVAITELMYNPADPATTAEEEFGNDDFEFIELTNLGTQRAYLTGFQLTEGITFDFATSAVPWLEPGESVVVVKDRDAFQTRYGTGIPIAGEYDGKLSNAGEEITLTYNGSETVQDFEYDDGGAWPGRADGTGSSLEVVDPSGDYDDPDNWRASGEYGGTPGSIGEGDYEGVVINEVLTHTDPPSTDTIELFNTTGESINIGGWYLSDAGGTLNKFRIPDGTTIPSGGYVTFDESDFNASGGIDPNDFALSSSEGDDVWLMEADASGNLLRFVDHVEFGAALGGESFGRYPNATGRLYPMSETTLGDENVAPRVGPVIISEIQYASAADGDTDPFEFVEIYNPTDDTIDLSNWEIDGIGYVFPEGSQIGAEEAIVVVPFDPADTQAMQAFLDYYEVTEVNAVGPYSGRLDNAGERIRLLSTDEPPADDPTLIPLITEDEVAYETAAPWPDLTADARSLNRAAVDAWGGRPGELGRRRGHARVCDVRPRHPGGPQRRRFRGKRRPGYCPRQLGLHGHAGRQIKR